MASSSSSLEQSSNFTCQTEAEMESSKTRHWSELDESDTSSEWSAEANYMHFAELKKDPHWGRFFIDSEGLEVGKKISSGAQAEVYEARMNRDGKFDLVVKVMRGDTSLQAFQAQWPIGMLSARSKYKHLYDLPLITIVGGTLLQDERLRGRFAFVMYRRWGDLRLLIDRRMKARRSTIGPFSIKQVIHLMLRIAEDMEILHTKHDILHKDLKAANVLVWGKFGEEVNFDEDETIELVVADFECSRFVMGTGFWKAPEIFQQLKDGVPSPEVKFTPKSDVYRYGMTSYEIVSCFIPFDHGHDFCEREEVLSGRRPSLSSELPLFLRNIILSCWHIDPNKRPTFSNICKLLKHKQGPNPQSVDIDNDNHEDATIIKVEQLRNLKCLTLLQVIKRLVHMGLRILKATPIFSTKRVVHFLRKLVGEDFTLHFEKREVKNTQQGYRHAMVWLQRYDSNWRRYNYKLGFNCKSLPQRVEEDNLELTLQGGLPSIVPHLVQVLGQHGLKIFHVQGSYTYTNTEPFISLAVF